MTVKYRGRTMQIAQGTHGALVARVDGKLLPITFIFERIAIAAAREFIDSQEVRSER